LQVQKTGGTPLQNKIVENSDYPKKCKGVSPVIIDFFAPTKKTGGAISSNK